MAALPGARTDVEPGLTAALRSRPRLPAAREQAPRRFQLGERVLLELQVPISGPSLEAGLGYAVFQISEQAFARIQRDLLITVAFVVLIVFATALLLYPIILTLMRRISRYAEGLLDANLETLQVPGSAIAKKDSDTDARNYRITLYSVRLAEVAGLDVDVIRTLIKGAFLHDIGKIGIRDEILVKPGRLDADEFAVMKQHVDHGLEIVGKSRWLEDAAAVVGSHHEKFDGSGYPAGSRGASIPILARIFAIADVFDALASKRPYKEPLSFEEKMQILEQGRGRHCDPDLLDSFAQIAPDLHARLCGRDDPQLRAELEQTVSRYFRRQAEVMTGWRATRSPESAHDDRCSRIARLVPKACRGTRSRAQQKSCRTCYRGRRQSWADAAAASFDVRRAMNLVGPIDRRLSVAPMLDWINSRGFSFLISLLSLQPHQGVASS